MNLKRAIYWPQRIWNKLHSQTLILLYHRVADLKTDPQLLGISPEHFAEHLEYLSDHYTPISLSALGRAIEAKKIPDKSVVITFDDGYADNFLNAKPLLEKYDIPATVFVASGYVGSNREFWWDELERLLLLPEDLPDKLELYINGTIHRWDLTYEIPGSKKGAGIDPRAWNVTMDVNPGPEYQVYRDLHKLMKPLPYKQQESILSTLAEWAGVSRTGRTTHRALTLDELKQLDQGGLIEIGAHTITHTMLSMQPVDVQKEEIIQSKISLEQTLDHQVQNFSYPYGGKADFNTDTVEKVRAAGITTACANYGLTLIKNADPYRLPRVLVRDWDIQVFSSRMKEWFDE